MGLIGNTPLAGKQPRLSPEEEKYLFDAGISYLSNGAPEAAYYCLDRITTPDPPQLFNKALCCYLSEWYEECHRLLDEAGQSLSNGLSRQESLLLPWLTTHTATACTSARCPGEYRRNWQGRSSSASKRKPLSGCNCTAK